MPGFSLTGPANRDISGILDYIAADNLDAALSMHQIFLDCFEFLSRSPKGGRQRDELESGLRSHPKGNYIIFYRIVETRIEIVRVLHAARDIEAIFS